MGIRPCRLVAIIIPLFLILFSCSDDSVNNINRPPAEPSNPVPPDGASQVGFDTVLRWDCPDPDGDDLRHDLYFGTIMDPPLVADNLSSAEYALEDLAEATNYYWRVTAVDSHDNVTEGPLWTFSTGVIPAVYYIATYNDPEGIYSYWVKDSLVYLPGSGLKIIDMIRFDQPRAIGHYSPPDTGTFYSDIFIRDDYAYLATGWGVGLDIIDISNPASPVFVGGCSSGSEFYAQAAAVQSSYAFLVAGDTSLFLTIDISDPGNPVVVNTCDMRSHGLLGWDIHVVEGTAFVHRYYLFERADFVTILDVSNPPNPIELFQISVDDVAVRISVAGDYLYIPYYPGGLLRIFDVTQPSNPELISEFYSGEGIFGVFTDNEYAYLAYYYSGLNIVDITDPAAPVIICESDVDAADIFVDGSFIYSSDGDDDLHVSWFVH